MLMGCWGVIAQGIGIANKLWAEGIMLRKFLEMGPGGAVGNMGIATGALRGSSPSTLRRPYGTEMLVPQEFHMAKSFATISSNEGGPI